MAPLTGAAETRQSPAHSLAVRDFIHFFDGTPRIARVFEAGVGFAAHRYNQRRQGHHAGCSCTTLVHNSPRRPHPAACGNQPFFCTYISMLGAGRPGV